MLMQRRFLNVTLLVPRLQESDAVIQRLIIFLFPPRRRQALFLKLLIAYDFDNLNFPLSHPKDEQVIAYNVFLRFLGVPIHAGGEI